MGSMMRRRKAEPTLWIDGAPKALSEIRSSGESPLGWIGAFSGAGDLAQAYRAGLTAYVAVNARAGIASEIPLVVVDANENPDDHSPLQDVVREDSALLWRATVCRLIFGAFFFRKYYNSYGYPSRIEWINPLYVQVDSLNGTVRGYRVQYPHRYEYVPSQQMIAHLEFDPLGQDRGLSPLEVAMTRIKVEANIGRFAESFFRNSAYLGGLLTYDGQIQEDEKKEVRSYWDKVFTGARNAFKTLILGSGIGGKWNWTPVQAAPVDLAMDQTMSQADIKICAAIGVHPALIGIGSVADALSAQSTFRQIRQHHLEFTAIPDARMIVDVFNNQWASDFGDKWRLDVDTGAILSDALASGERSGTARENYRAGIWTLDEAREHTGKKPVAGLQRDSSGALQLWQSGVMKRNEVRLALGMKPDAVDGYVYEVDPRAAPQPALPLALSAEKPQLKIAARATEGEADTREDFFQNFDALQAELGATWIDEYMRMVGTWVKAQIAAGQTPDWEALQAHLATHHPDLKSTWVGTVDQPGILTSLVMAGMGAGVGELQKAGVKVGLEGVLLTRADGGIQIKALEAIRFAEQYFFDLIRRIDATTQQAVQDAVLKWLNAVPQPPMSSLGETLQDIFLDKRRARLIAQTESTRVYAQGAAAQYEKAGVRRFRWYTVNVGRNRLKKQKGDVCAICSPMHKLESDESGTWIHPRTGQRMGLPPAHPGCRCYIQPITDDLLKAAGLS